MHRLYELSAKLTAARHLVELLGYQNRPSDHRRLVEADARYQLAHDSMMRAERAYLEELARTDDETLLAVANDLATSGETVDQAQRAVDGEAN